MEEQKGNGDVAVSADNTSSAVALVCIGLVL